MKMLIAPVKNRDKYSENYLSPGDIDQNHQNYFEHFLFFWSKTLNKLKIFTVNRKFEAISDFI